MTTKPRCPECGCKRYRNIGEMAAVGVARRKLIMKIVECMRCDYAWDTLMQDKEGCCARKAKTCKTK